MVLGAGVSDGGLLVDVDVPQRHLATAARPAHRGARPSRPSPRTEVRRILRNRLAEIEQERASVGPPRRASELAAAPCGTPADRASRPTAGSTEKHRLAHPPRPRRVPRPPRWARRQPPSWWRVTSPGSTWSACSRRTLGTWSAPRHRPVASPGRPGAGSRRRPRRGRRPARLGADRDRRRAGPARTGPRPTAGRPTRCSPSCSAARRAPGSTPCCARRRATPTASARAFRPTGRRAARSSRPARCARRSRGRRSRSCSASSTVHATGFTDAEVRSGVDYVAKTAPGRYATADAVADETAALALEGLPARLHHPQPARRGRPSKRRDLDEAYRRVATGEWSVVLVGDAADRGAGPRGPGRRAGEHG